MGKTVRLCLLPLAGIALVSFAGCGKSNIFSWAHKAGGSGDTQALYSDATAALQNQDYAKALEYYQKILESDPNNSEAIYGYSASELANAGLDIGSLVSNLIREQQGGNSVSGLSGAIARAGRTYASPSSPENLLPQTMLARAEDISNAIERVLPRLSRIVNGTADGKISPRNPDVNLNLAVCYVLHAALTIRNYVDFDTNYAAAIKPGVTLADALPDLNTAANDLVNAYNCMLVVVDELHLADGSTIGDIKSQVRDLFKDYEEDIEGQGVPLDAQIN
ncbi:MAG: hypothetical protein ACYC5N_10830 [Endomicrobiales bacterium]